MTEQEPRIVKETKPKKIAQEYLGGLVLLIMLIIAALYSLLNSTDADAAFIQFLSLYSVFVIGAFVVLEAWSWRNCFKQYARLRSSHASACEMPLARPLYFLANVVRFCDAAFIVLIAANITANTPFEGNTLVLTLPVLLTTFGYLAGTVLYGAIMPKFPAKTVLACAGIAATILFTACAFAVLGANIMLLSILLFLASSASQMIFMASDGIVLNASKHERLQLNRANAEAKISGYTIGVLLASFLVDLFGSCSVYFFAAIVSLLLVAFVCYLLPSSGVLDSARKKARTQRTSSRTNGMKRLLTSPVVLVNVFAVILGLAFLSGYRNIIFPLYAAEQGVDMANVAQLLVFANVAVYCLSPLLVALESTMGSSKMILVLSLVSGLSMITLALPIILPWAIAVLFLSNATAKIGKPCTDAVWQDCILAYGAPKEAGVGAMHASTHLTDLIRTPILGALCMLGVAASGLFMGIFIIVGGFTFRVIAKRHSIGEGIENAHASTSLEQNAQDANTQGESAQQ